MKVHVGVPVALGLNFQFVFVLSFPPKFIVNS